VWSGGSAENLAFGISDGSGFVYQLYIDDGVSSRGHRKSIVNPNFTKTGIAYCKHSITSGMLVATYAGGFKEHGQEAEPAIVTRPVL